ncbi:MAG: hypothetical protein IPO21_01250 [Bacteroidales bacterium]|nr:hypothetical protein [Bacteroidales bacterium]
MTKNLFLNIIFFIIYNVCFGQSFTAPLALWYRSDSVHLALDKVDTLYDMSGKSNHLVQHTKSTQPTVKQSISQLNNKDVVYFSGSERLNSIKPVVFQELYVLFNWEGGDQFSAYNGLLSGSSGSGSSNLLCGTTGSTNFYNEPSSFAANIWINGMKQLNISLFWTIK